MAFAPIDDENTLLYLCPYQRKLRLPPPRRLMDLLLLLSSVLILRQDKPVVLSQHPRRTWLKMGE